VVGKQKHRERILEVAKGAFTRHGADASLDEIAKQADVGAGTLYHLFEIKRGRGVGFPVTRMSFPNCIISPFYEQVVSIGLTLTPLLTG